MITPDSENIEKCRIGTGPIKNHFGPPDIWNGPMKNLMNEKLRLNGTNFEFILNRILAMIVKQPTNMIPNPVEEYRQLALTIYRFAYAHRCSFDVL